MENPTERAVLGLVEANSLLLAAMDRHLRRICGLSHPQFEIMGRLHDSAEGVRMSDLAGMLVFSASGITYQATRLEKRGLLVREKPSGGDERTVVARLTPQGRELVGAVTPRHLAFVQQLVDASLTPQQVGALGDTLQTLIATLRAA